MSKKGCILISIIILILLILICACCAGAVVLTSSTSTNLSSEINKLNTKTLTEGGDDKILVIPINGTIMDVETQSDLWGSNLAGSRTIIDELNEASADSSVKAVVLDINSPGGDVYASDEIYKKILETKDAGKKIITVMRGTAASGGYYVAAASDKIVASELTVTGSIGVYLQVQSMEGLYEKLGIKTRTITNSNGTYKTGSGLFDSDPNGEEDQIYQKLVDEAYDRFVTVVSEGRNMSKEEVKKLADGRIYTGKQAFDLKLIDQIGNYEDAIALAQEEAGISDPTIIQYEKNSFWSILYGAVSNFGNPIAQFAKYYDLTSTVKVQYLLTADENN